MSNSMHPVHPTVLFHVFLCVVYKLAYFEIHFFFCTFLYFWKSKLTVRLKTRISECFVEINNTFISPRCVLSLHSVLSNFC